MSQELEEVRDRRFRTSIPEAHQQSLDTRLAWLWNQRAGTIQAVRSESEDVLDYTAATMMMQALFGKDLAAISLILQRLEGGTLTDAQIAEQGELHI